MSASNAPFDSFDFEFVLVRPNQLKPHPLYRMQQLNGLIESGSYPPPDLLQFLLDKTPSAALAELPVVVPAGPGRYEVIANQRSVAVWQYLYQRATSQSLPVLCVKNIPKTQRERAVLFDAILCGSPKFSESNLIGAGEILTVVAKKTAFKKFGLPTKLEFCQMCGLTPDQVRPKNDPPLCNETSSEPRQQGDLYWEHTANEDQGDANE